MITDAKKCDATFSKEEKKIHIDIKGRGTKLITQRMVTFCLSVPHELLDGNYSVYVDGKAVAFKENITQLGPNPEMFHSEISFNYTKDATRVDVIGTTAIPEFGSPVLLLLLVGISTITCLIIRFRAQSNVHLS